MKKRKFADGGIYTAEMGQPPMEPDGGSVSPKPVIKKPVPKLMPEKTRTKQQAWSEHLAADQAQGAAVRGMTTEQFIRSETSKANKKLEEDTDPGGYKKGGMTDAPQYKSAIKKAFKQHDAQEHKGGKGTSLKLAKGGKMRKYAEGGLTSDEQEAADKAAGLEASNKEPSAGVFARFKAGNIDQPGSEAYEKYGAGRGKAIRTARTPGEPSVAAKLEQGVKEVSLPTMVEDERPAPIGMGYATKFLDAKSTATPAAKPAAVVAAKPPTKPAVKAAAITPPATNDELEDYARTQKDKQNLNTISSEEKARRKKMESDQALQKVYPEEVLVGQASIGLKGIAALAKKLASRKATTEPTRAAIKELGRPSPSTSPYLQELGYTPKQLGNSPLGIGMKKGGMAKTSKSSSTHQMSSASRRGDGIALRGKTRGKMV